MNLFVSYARVDKPYCEQIVRRLEDVHDVWYDRRLHAGQEWWNVIIERLKWCEGFVYLLSPESVASKYCKDEHNIAVAYGKGIFPVLIRARTEIPDSLKHIHYADLSESMEDIITLLNALTVAERQLRNAPPPVVDISPNLEAMPKQESPTETISQTAELIEAENFDAAVFVIKQALEQNPSGRAGRMLHGMLGEAEAGLERQAYLREAAREYAQIREVVTRASTRSLGCDEFAAFVREFPDYDPDNFADLCGQSTTTERGSNANLPVLLDWIDIPAGAIYLDDFRDESAKTYVGKESQSEVVEVPAFRIAKYPVTNAQFAMFIEAGGYGEKRWWTDAGWSQCEQAGWTEPRYWADPDWNSDEQPVVGVSWYEAAAFCMWLSEVSREKIMLPTELQWQRAAQGDDGRVYPWGDVWDCKKCNNSVAPCESDHTTPVSAFKGTGDSPYGVVDMSGNVWEWCLTEYETGNTSLSGNSMRILHGGSWGSVDAEKFCAAARARLIPDNSSLHTGFRCARLL